MHSTGQCLSIVAPGRLISLKAAAATVPALAQRSDAVPSRDARKENEQQRLATRYKADSAHVQAFYRTNGYE